MSDVKVELRRATDPADTAANNKMCVPRPSLQLRSLLARFAHENELRNEEEAMLVVALRYFVDVETKQLRAWIPGTETRLDVP